MRSMILAAMLLAAACTTDASPITPVAPPLTPYASKTPPATLDSVTEFLVSASTALPSPTPSQYTVRQGDTLSEIAERFRITLDALLAANPALVPSALRVGEILSIPASPADLAGEATPTPIPFAVRQIACHPTASGAIWCFVFMFNDTRDILENVTAQVSLVDSRGATVDSRTALLPLDILRPGTGLPLSVLFPPPLPLGLEPRVQILTAIAIPRDDPRYLSATLRNTAAEVTWAGRSAEVRGELSLSTGQPDAAIVWIAAVAFDRHGDVVGWRRWEATGLAAGASIPFELTLSSVAGRIDRVEFAVEARP